MVADWCLDCWKGIYLGTGAFLVNELICYSFGSWRMDEFVNPFLFFRPDSGMIYTPIWKDIVSSNSRCSLRHGDWSSINKYLQCNCSPNSCLLASTVARPVSSEFKARAYTLYSIVFCYSLFLEKNYWSELTIGWSIFYKHF